MRKSLCEWQSMEIEDLPADFDVHFRSRIPRKRRATRPNTADRCSNSLFNMWCISLAPVVSRTVGVLRFQELPLESLLGRFCRGKGGTSAAFASSLGSHGHGANIV